MKIKRIGVDLAKNVFQLHGVDRTWQKQVWIASAAQARQMVSGVVYRYRSPPG